MYAITLFCLASFQPAGVNTLGKKCQDCKGQLVPALEHNDAFVVCDTCKKIYTKDGDELVSLRQGIALSTKHARSHEVEPVFWVGKVPMPQSVMIQHATQAYERLLLNDLQRQQIYDLTVTRLGVFNDTAYELVELVGNREYPPHRHIASDGVFLFIVGEGNVRIGDQDIAYGPGKKVEAPKGVYHGFRPTSNTLFLSIQSPPVIHDGKVDIEF